MPKTEYEILSKCLRLDILSTYLPKDNKPSIVRRWGKDITAAKYIPTAKHIPKAFVNDLTLDINGIVRPFRTIGKRKPRMSRVTDIQIIQMNVLYEKGERMESIAHFFKLSFTYCNNLISRYRNDNDLPYLSKADRGVVITNTMDKPNKDKIKRAETKIRRAEIRQWKKDKEINRRLR